MERLKRALRWLRRIFTTRTEPTEELREDRTDETRAKGISHAHAQAIEGNKQRSKEHRQYRKKLKTEIEWLETMAEDSRIRRIPGLSKAKYKEQAQILRQSVRCLRENGVFRANDEFTVFADSLENADISEICAPEIFTPSFIHFGSMDEEPKNDDFSLTEYGILIHRIRRTPYLPPGVISRVPGWPISRETWWWTPFFGHTIASYPFVIGLDKKIYPCYRKEARPFGGTEWREMDPRTKPDEPHLTREVAVTFLFGHYIDFGWRLTIRGGNGVMMHSILPESDVVKVLPRSSRRGGRVIHWVKAHERSNGSHVRTHIRGSNEFELMGKRAELNMPGWKSEMETERFETSVYENKHSNLFDVEFAVLHPCARLLNAAKDRAAIAQSR